MSGAFVVLEGIDQAGKMTLARSIQARLRDAGLRCEVRHYPDYDTAIGRLIRSLLYEQADSDPRTRCLLFAANRWEKDAELRRLRQENTLVVVDRYTWSNVVYGVGQGLPEEWLCGLEAGLLEPDLTFLVDITPQESLRRKAEDRDRFERDLRLLETAREFYVRTAGGRDWAVLDGTLAPAVLAERALEILRHRLAARLPALDTGRA